VAAQTVETPLAHSSSLEQRSSVLPEASAARQIDAVRAAASTAAGLLDQEPHSGLPSPDRRSPSVRDLPVAAADIPGTATPETGSPQAWAARLAFQRQEPPPPPAPIAASTPAILHDDTAPGERNGLYGIQAASAQLLAATADQHPATPRRFIAARRVDQAATPAVPADTHTATIERSPVASAAVADVPAAIVPEPRSPQAWAARFATHSQATALGKAESTSARPPTPLSLAPIAPVTPPVGVDAPAASEPDAPHTWAARLFPQAQPAQLPNIGTPTEQRSHALDSAPQAMLRNALPTPTAETTRRFLTPLVGIDPATVRIFRGPQAEQVTAAYKAEALASGDTIALSAQHSEDTPAALGVLAHELTHIARQRDARFVPPLAQRSRAFIGAGADEELLAQSVDAQVQQIARKRAAPATSRLQSHAAESGMLHDLDNTTPALPSPHAAPKAQSAIHSADWGSLPAPWEVLPEWLTTPPATEAALPVRSQSPGPAQPIAERNAAPPQSQRMSGTAAVRETQPVQLAEASRSLAAQPAQSAPTSTPAQQPTPDLDALARQVYAVLKQRLAAERRRSQS